MDKHLQKISIDDQTFYIFTNMPSSLDKFSDTSVYKNNCFDVSLSNGKEIYSGKVYVADVLKMSSVVDIEKDNFYDTLRQCLCNLSSNSSQFTYHISENDDSSLKFVWKQVLDEEMTFQLGSMLLMQEGNPELKTLDIFAFLSQKVSELSKEVTNVSNKNRSLEVEKKEMTKRLDGYVQTKESLEKDLFTKFSFVLNEKKARIRELKTKLDKGCDDNKETITKKKEERSGDTDTDEENEKTKRNKRTIKIKTDRNEKYNDNKLDIILDASIDDDEEDVPRKNRKRIRTNKPKVPVQSILPRTSSTFKPPKQPSPPPHTNDQKEIKPKQETQEEDLLDQLMF